MTSRDSDFNELLAEYVKLTRAEIRMKFKALDAQTEHDIVHDCIEAKTALLDYAQKQEKRQEILYDTLSDIAERYWDCFSPADQSRLSALL